MKGCSWFFGWQPERDQVFELLRAPAFQRFKLQSFPRGIDNVHIDVALDGDFVSACSSMVGTLLREDVHKHFWKQQLRTADSEVSEVFRSSYLELTQWVIKQARAELRLERVQLYQLAVFKLLLALVDREQRRLRHELEEASAHPARQQSGQALELHERKVVLGRFAGAIRYRASHDVMRKVARIEHNKLRKMRKTIIGASWPIAPELLFNPLLQMGGLGEPDDWLAHYPYFLRDEVAAKRMNQCFMSLLFDYRPDGMQHDLPNSPGDEALSRSRRDQGELPGYIEVERLLLALVSDQELESAVPHIWDDRENLARMLGMADDDLPKPWQGRRFVRFTRCWRKRVLRQLQKAGLLRSIVASWQLKQLYPELGLLGQAQLVYEYLNGTLKRRDLIRRFDALSEIPDAEAVVARIDTTRKGLPRSTGEQLRSLAVEALLGFAELRAHLKYAWWMYRGMDSLRLLFDQREQAMSKANGLLQRFSASLPEGAQEQVVGHVIIKADVRGSTEITAQMRARHLNPAAYFSRNLYDPINALLSDYGAEKVFVEGDAVILAIMETRGASGQHQAVARACGLAQRMLEVVHAKNAESRRMELPELELGLGIAYSDEAPTYLYDDNHKIMISSAINRADRLSSCHSRLRAARNALNAADAGVEVVTRVASAQTPEQGEELLRYNVNGIELEAAAMYQLASEIQLRGLTLDAQRYGSYAGDYQVGRYHDIKGNSHWLIVREAPIRLWLGAEFVDEGEHGRRFYQVSTDKQLRALVKKRFAAKAAG